MSGLGCLFDPGPCIASGVHGLLAAVPWWAWVVLVLVVIGLVGQLAGWPGLVGLALAAGYLAGRSDWTPYPSEHVDGPDAEPPVPRRKVKPKPRPKTLEDLFRDGLK